MQIFNSTTCHSNQKWNNDKWQAECKRYCACKNYYSCNLSSCICKNIRFLKNIFDDSVIFCNDIINVANIVLTNMTDTTSTNALSTVTINCNNKKVKRKVDCYVLYMHIFTSNNVLLMIANIWYHYAITGQNKKYWHTNTNFW